MANNTVSINKIVSIFQDLSIRQEMVYDFGYGPAYNIGASKEMKFPYIWIENNNTTTQKSDNGYKVNLYTFTIYCMDKINFGEDNYNEIISDTHYILDTMVAEISQHKYYVDMNLSIDGDINFLPVVEATDDNVNGWQCDITIKHPIRYTYCNSPIEPITGYITQLNNSFDEYKLVGATGPTGPAGPTGATGPAGVNGATGPTEGLWKTLDIGNTASTFIDMMDFGITNLGYNDFDLNNTITNTTGRLNWNDTDGTLDLGLKGGNVTLQIGQEEVIRVVNKTGSNLLESQYNVVRIRTQAEGGAQGQRLAVLLAQADTKPNHSGILGVVTENINNNQEGFITSFGAVRKINTTGSLQGETWLDGDDLWLSDTVAGGLTNIEPTTHPVRIGYVLYSHAVNGKIFVSLDNGVDELNELHDVTITSPIGGDTLQYNSTLSLWENTNPFFIIDLMDNSSVEFYVVQDTKINTITNVVNSPTITIADDGAPYTLTNTILTGSKITVTSDIPSVIKLNIEE